MTVYLTFCFFGRDMDHGQLKTNISLNFNGESWPASVSGPYHQLLRILAVGISPDGMYSSEIRGELGAGLLDLHATDYLDFFLMYVQNLSATLSFVFLVNIHELVAFPTLYGFMGWKCLHAINSNLLLFLWQDIDA